MRIHKYKRTICVLVLLILLAAAVAGQSVHADSTQKNIAKEVIRFHILANSDSEKDQDLKILVKDQIVLFLQEKLKNIKSIEEARAVIKKQLSELEKLAVQIMKQEGYDYSAKAVLENREFPVKIYGDLVFPAGEYEALQIRLGKAEGKNWWCVMFPALCFVDDTYHVVPEKSKEELKHVLSEEEYESLVMNNNRKVTFKFKFMEWIKDLFS